jgi:hypothetical protein
VRRFDKLFSWPLIAILAVGYVGVVAKLTVDSIRHGIPYVLQGGDGDETEWLVRLETTLVLVGVPFIVLAPFTLGRRSLLQRLGEWRLGRALRGAKRGSDETKRQGE